MTKLKIFLIICVIICANLLFSLKQHKEQSEVVFWTVQLSPFSDYINGVITEFEQMHPYIKVKWVDVPYSEAEKRVLASLLSNSMPDLVNITSDFNMTLASKGALLPIDDGLWAYNATLLRAVTYDDKVWGLPFYATSAVTIYNKELMSEFAITKPASTYDEVFAQMEVAPQLVNKYLFMPTINENDTLYKILNKYGVNSPQTIISSESERIFAELKKLYLEGKIPKEAITQTHREVLEKYSAGQIVYLQAGANFLNIIKENSPDVYSKTDVAEQFSGKDSAFDFSLMTLAVPLKAQNKKEAVLFARYLTNPQNQLEFAKITGVLPCNKSALSESYFLQVDTTDLSEKARYIGAKQLSNPIIYPAQKKHHKDVIVLLNSLSEQILLGGKDIGKMLYQTKDKWNALNAD